MSLSDFLHYTFVENIWILLVLLITSITCGIIGSVLVLRKLSMVADAISHSVLLGIVLAFFISKDLTSPLLVIGAAIFGILTVFAIESLSKTNLVKSDDAVGIVFPLFFALAVILITKFARNAHIDVDIVLMGEVILSPLNTIGVLGYEIPKAFVYMSILFFVNLGFITLFFKEIKLTTFDEEYSTIIGFSSGLLFYGLMTLISFTTVVAFDGVGAILVISFLVAPGSSAYLLTKNLKHMIFLSVIYSFVNSTIGYLLGMYFNLSISGMTATIAGVTFFLTFLLNREGYITQIFLRHKKKVEFKKDLFILHLGNHRGEKDEIYELGISTIKNHLLWSDEEIKKYSKPLIDSGDVVKLKEIYSLTEKGINKYMQLKREYGLGGHNEF